jgi:hypothetical protein
MGKWGDLLPDENRLPSIALAYGIEFQELLRAYRISKEARDMEKAANARPKKIEKKGKQDPAIEAFDSGRRVRPKSPLDGRDPN